MEINRSTHGMLIHKIYPKYIISLYVLRKKAILVHYNVKMKMARNIRYILMKVTEHCLEAEQLFIKYRVMMTLIRKEPFYLLRLLQVNKLVKVLIIVKIYVHSSKVEIIMFIYLVFGLLYLY